jgi:hypothetical protein
MNHKLRIAALAVLCASSGVAIGATVAGAGSGTPEVDRANATIKVNGQLNPLRCIGEDKLTYITYTGSWKGAETQLLPDPTDYPLSGSFVVNGIQWTINLKTGRGVLTGQASLLNAAGPVYSGLITLVTQGMPVAGALVPGRGWITGAVKLPDEGVTPGDDRLMANVEFQIGLTSALGEFGDLPGSFKVPDFSAMTNVAPVALDGTC